MFYEQIKINREIRENNGKFHLHTTRFEYKLEWSRIDKAFFLYKCFMKKSNSKLTEKFVYIYLH
jgi:hypothetical protein